MLNFLYLLNTRKIVDREVAAVRFEMQKSNAVRNCGTATTAMSQIRSAARRDEWGLVSERLPEVRVAMVAVSVIAPAIGADVGNTVEKFLSQLTVIEKQAEKAASTTPSVNFASIRDAIITQNGKLASIQAACENTRPVGRLQARSRKTQ